MKLDEIKIVASRESASTDLANRQRVSIPTTVANYKNLYGTTISNAVWDFKGTGTTVYENGETSLRVTAGQYRIMQSKEYHYYVAGQPMKFDITGNHFQKDTGLTKRVGAFSSNAVAPYDSDLDGIWFEANGTDDKYWFKIYRRGVEVIKQEIIPPSGYDFFMFNYLGFDYVWQGGRYIRLQGQLPNGDMVNFAFINYAQNYHLPFCMMPYLPLRLEIRSTTGVGQIDLICGAVNRDDGTDKVEVRIRNTPYAPVFNIANIGTRYVLGALRKNSNFREAFAQVTGGSVALTTADTVLIEFVKNPTLTAGTLTYTAIPESSCEYAQGNGTQTIGNTGLNIGGFMASNTSPITDKTDNLLSTLYGGIDNSMDVIMMVATPITATVSISNIITFKDLL